jgi:hypothetical protein
MSKKTFSAAPKPKTLTDDQILAFERAGVGHDTPAATKSPEKVTAEPKKRLSVDLPERMHMRFKTACSATGRKMVDEMHSFIERRTSELEMEAGITRK